MNRAVCLVLALGLSLVPFCSSWADEPAREDAKAIAEIKRLGGDVQFDEKAPGKPVTSVSFLSFIGPALTGHGPSSFGDAEMIYLKDFHHLQYLDLRDTKITDAGLIHLKELHELTGLMLHSTQVTDKGLEHLKVLRQLEALGLVGTKVTDAGMQCVAGFPQLKGLYLDDTQIGDAGLRHLKGLTRIVELTLRNTRVADDGLQYIAGFTQLGALALEGTRITDDGLQYVAGFTQLGTLFLERKTITDAGLKHLEGLAKLQVLMLKHTEVSNEAFKKLQQTLPKCQIVRREEDLRLPSPPEAPPTTPGVTVVRVEDIRSTLQPASWFFMELRVSCTEFERAVAFRCRAQKALDDTGADLVLCDKKPDFDACATLNMKQPVRKATALKEVTGVVEVFLPHRDPESIVEVTGFIGKPRWEVSHPSLMAGRTKLTILSKSEVERVRQLDRKEQPPKPDPQNPAEAMCEGMAAMFGEWSDLNENDVIILAEDPEMRVVKIEFVDRFGEPIDGNAWLHDGRYVCNFNQKPPETTVMRIQVATPKAVAELPFTFKDVALP